MLKAECPWRPSPEFAWGKGCAASTVATSAVWTVGGASSSSSAGGARPSPMEAESEKEYTAQERTVEQFSASGGRFEWLYSYAATSEESQELEPDTSESPSSLSGVVISSDVPTGESVDVEDVDASPGEIGRQDVSSFQSIRDFEFGEPQKGADEFRRMRSW